MGVFIKVYIYITVQIILQKFWQFLKAIVPYTLETQKIFEKRYFSSTAAASGREERAPYK